MAEYSTVMAQSPSIEDLAFDALVSSSMIQDPIRHVNAMIETLMRVTVAVRKPLSADRYNNSRRIQLRDHELFVQADGNLLSTGNFERMRPVLRDRMLSASLERRRFLQFAQDRRDKFTFGLDAMGTQHGANDAGTFSRGESDSRDEDSVVSYRPPSISVSAIMAHEPADEWSDRSSESSLSLVSSITSGGERRLRVPPFPKEAENRLYLCPCCYLIMTFNSPMSWKYVQIRTYSCLVKSTSLILTKGDIYLPISDHLFAHLTTATIPTNSTLAGAHGSNTNSPFIDAGGNAPLGAPRSSPASASWGTTYVSSTRTSKTPRSSARFSPAERWRQTPRPTALSACEHSHPESTRRSISPITRNRLPYGPCTACDSLPMSLMESQTKGLRRPRPCRRNPPHRRRRLRSRASTPAEQRTEDPWRRERELDSDSGGFCSDSLMTLLAFITRSTGDCVLAKCCFVPEIQAASYTALLYRSLLLTRPS